MTFKTILVHCDSSPRLADRLAVGVDLAQRFSARLIGVYVQEPLDVPAYFDATVPTEELMAFHESAARKEQEAARAVFDKAVKGHGSTEWRLAEGYPENELVVQSRYADLLVLGKAEADGPGATPPDLPETVTLASGRPVLVVPYLGAGATVGRSVMLCWNASRESARAARDSLPLLAAAEKVTVLVVDGRQSAVGHGPEPGADVARWLASHGVNVTVQRDVAADADVGNVILSRAADLGIDLIVMGLYGHSRLRQMVLGGVSRTLLASMTVPVLMAH